MIVFRLLANKIPTLDDMGLPEVFKELITRKS
jgi:Tfp pilus assembly ATPase PilU